LRVLPRVLRALSRPPPAGWNPPPSAGTCVSGLRRHAGASGQRPLAAAVAGRVGPRVSVAGVLAVRAALLQLRPVGPVGSLLVGGNRGGRGVPVPVTVPVPVGLDRDTLGEDPVDASPHPPYGRAGVQGRDL